MVFAPEFRMVGLQTIVLQMFAKQLQVALRRVEKCERFLQLGISWLWNMKYTTKRIDFILQA